MIVLVQGESPMLKNSPFVALQEGCVVKDIDNSNVLSQQEMVAQIRRELDLQPCNALDVTDMKVILKLYAITGNYLAGIKETQSLKEIGQRPSCPCDILSPSVCVVEDTNVNHDQKTHCEINSVLQWLRWHRHAAFRCQFCHDVVVRGLATDIRDDVQKVGVRCQRKDCAVHHCDRGHLSALPIVVSKIRLEITTVTCVEYPLCNTALRARASRVFSQLQRRRVHCRG